MRLNIFAIFFLATLGCQNDTVSHAPKANFSKISTPILDTFNSTPIVSYRTSPDKINFFLKDDKGNYFNNHGNLKTYLHGKGKKLIFAMNGGMYLEDSSPQGLYIENFEVSKSLNKKDTSYGNFYMKPNGIFYITEKGGFITSTASYTSKTKAKFATQSGPMLVIKNRLHTKFVKNSKYYHIRNGVGILPDGQLLFAMSYEPITFYDFAMYFKKEGCKNALYLDGAISKTYLPSKGIEQTTGKFGVIIAETNN